ncbi:UNVERIFIED_CONTAM: hypothetical protein NCL1_25377 [Trichonephila clavipes]
MEEKLVTSIKLPELEEFSTDQLFFITYGSVRKLYTLINCKNLIFLSFKMLLSIYFL